MKAGKEPKRGRPRRDDVQQRDLPGFIATGLSLLDDLLSLERSGQRSETGNRKRGCEVQITNCIIMGRIWGSRMWTRVNSYQRERRRK